MANYRERFLQLVSVCDTCVEVQFAHRPYHSNIEFAFPMPNDFDSLLLALTPDKLALHE